MLKKFASWFIIFGLSFLVESLGWTEQGKAFMYINLGTTMLIVMVVLATVAIAGATNGGAAEANGYSFLALLIIVVSLAIILFATWGATKLFNVDFYVAYQIMTFGQCLSGTSKKKND